MAFRAIGRAVFIFDGAAPSHASGAAAPPASQLLPLPALVQLGVLKPVFGLKGLFESVRLFKVQPPDLSESVR